MARTWVALLRGINVGGRKIVKMAELRTLCKSLGLRNASTYLQSGNVVFEADSSSEAALTRRLEEAAAERFGFRIEFFLRSAAEIASIVDRNPFANRDLPQIKWLAVMFLREPPDAAATDAFIDSYAGPEELVRQGRDLYIYYAEGMGRSKLTQAMAPLELNGTVRNWNTILKLRAAT